MLHFLLAAPLFHVPIYDNCVDNCCKPFKDVDISQVLYLKGSGGLEIHLDKLSEGQVLDVDAVFRDEVDQTTYDLYVGCGGCMPSDSIVISPYNLSGYQPVEIEPFTQTAYRSVFSKEERKFNTSSLSACSEGHFTIRLVTNDTSLVWGAVIGLAESFTFLELLEFPIYILRNHGDSWNQLGYTYWILLFLVAPLFLVTGRAFYKMCCGCYIPSIYDYEVTSVREFLYELSFIGFIAATLEMLVHLVYVQVGNPVGWGFWVGLVIIIFPAALAETFLYVVWYGLRRPDTCGGCLASPYWAPLEIVTGFTFLLLFGSGFYVGPAAIMIAGIIRLKECKKESLPATQEVPDQRVTVTIPRRKGYAGEVEGVRRSI
jgi:hypothetical protein